MFEKEYQERLSKLREEWGSVHVEHGIVRADNDPLTGFIVGIRAPLIAEIINRALSGQYDER